jgi:tight adherence protein C
VDNFTIIAQTEGLPWQLLLPIAVFGAVGAAAWFLLEYFGGNKGRAEERLDEFRDPAVRRDREKERNLMEQDTMTQVLESGTAGLAQPLMPKNEAEASELKTRLGYAGFRTEAASQVFLGIKFLLLLLGLVIGGGTSIFFLGLTLDGMLRGGIVAGVCFYIPDAVLWYLIRCRQDEIFYGLPDALDLMVVCVEAGLGLDQAMRKVAEEMKKSYRIVSDEFSLCNFQLQVGRTKSEVLHELGSRTGVDDLKSLASILIQADKFGSSIAQALRVQSESMRTRRRQMAEEQAAKTAVKLIFPLVIFIFPGIFVVLVGPAAITMVREMFPAMNGGGS